MVRLLAFFAFLSVLLRALTLAGEALTVGGILFLLGVARPVSETYPYSHLRRLAAYSAALLVLAQAAAAAANSAILIASTGMSWTDVVGANYLVAAIVVTVGGLVVLLSVRTRLATVAGFGAVAVLCGMVMATHSVSRMDQRWVATALTFAHHATAAAWVGGLPYLLLSLRYCRDADAATVLTKRFSRLAMASVAILLAAGAGMSFLYLGSPAATFGTTYGLMVLSKVLLTTAVLALGALNRAIVRSVRAGRLPDMLQLRRFAEAETGIGITIILAAASLTSTPPAANIQADRVTPQDIADRMRPHWPRLTTPAVSELSPATALKPIDVTMPGSFVPGQVVHPNTPADIAWSEYNHHWAGLIVLAMGLLSLAARKYAWARHWPLVFLALALFLFVRADSENWPLGPVGFWASFREPEVAQHRFFVLLIIAFAVYEWLVQTGRVPAQRAGLVFPAVCAIGGALLLTHSHALGNIKEEFLAELSHIPLAILAVVAGWSRWLEIRLPTARSRPFAWIWPPCFVVIGMLLLNYREA